MHIDRDMKLCAYGVTVSEGQQWCCPAHSHILETQKTSRVNFAIMHKGRTEDNNTLSSILSPVPRPLCVSNNFTHHNNTLL